MTSVNYQPPIDYAQKSSSSPYYQYSKIQQKIGGLSVPITQNNSTISYFDIPAQVYNLAQSFLQFNLTIPEIPAVNGNERANGCLLNIPPIRSIRLANLAGLDVCRIDNFQHYWKMTKNCIVSREDFAKYTPPGTGIAVVAAQSRGVTNFHNPANLITATAPATASLLNNSMILYTANDATVSPDLAADATTAYRGIFDRDMQIQTGTLSADPNPGSAIILYCHLEFGKIPFSFFNVNKDFFSTEALQLIIEWEATNNWAYRHSAVNTLAGTAQSTVTPVLDNLALYLAVEMNEPVRQSVMSKVQSGGLQMTIPYSYLYQTNIGVNTAYATNLKLNRAHGERLLRIITALNYGALDTLSNRCNFSNGTGTFPQTYHTELDNKRLQTEELSNISSDGFKYNLPKLKNSVLSNMIEYYFNSPVHIDDWSACDSLDQAPELDLTLCGMPLDKELMYTHYITAKDARQATVNMIAVTQKTLVSGPSGVQI